MNAYPKGEIYNHQGINDSSELDACVCTQPIIVFLQLMFTSSTKVNSNHFSLYIKKSFRNLYLIPLAIDKRVPPLLTSALVCSKV